jgi:hypothetical protein
VKRWQAIAALLIAVLMLLFFGAPALAQGFEGLPPVFATVIAKTGVLVDQVLGHWVAGDDLTAQGTRIIGALAQSVVNTVHFLARMVTWF